MIIVDASAIVAMLTREPDADTLVSALAASGRAETTPIAIYEAVLGLSRKRQWSVAEAETHVGDFLRVAGVVIQPIQPETVHRALEAFVRYRKGRGHPARLNLGDCFIYAQAKVGGASLLYKGEDFSKTDIESASEWPPLPVRPNLTAGLGVSISRGRTAEGNRDRVVGR